MFNDILLALWFFSPAGVANVSPILVAKLPGLKNWDYPIDFFAMLRGKRVFGAHKTWRGLVTGVVFAIITLQLQVWLTNHSAWLQSFTGSVDYAHINVLLVGFLFGFGALGGDALKSFFKRQIDVRPGQSWFPFDQIDYILGGAVATAFVVRLHWQVYIYVLVLWLAIHLFSSYLGYLWKLKDRPI